MTSFLSQIRSKTLNHFINVANFIKTNGHIAPFCKIMRIVVRFLLVCKISMCRDELFLWS